MNRRNFLGLLGGVAACAAVRTWPFRVYSFPQEIVAPEIGGWVSYRIGFTVSLPPPGLTVETIRAIFCSRPEIICFPPDSSLTIPA